MSNILVLLDQSDQLSAQIQFCDEMALNFAIHDRDISKMYQSISQSLRSLDRSTLFTTDPDERANYDTNPKSKPNAINPDRQ